MTQGTAGGPDLAEPADRGLDPQHHLLQQRHGVQGEDNPGQEARGKVLPIET